LVAAPATVTTKTLEMTAVIIAVRCLMSSLDV
jgi:hypothetical protein